MEKLKSKIREKRGESLVETIVSVFIFALMMTAVSLIVSTALKMIQFSSIEAEKNQTHINNVIAGTAVASDETLIFDIAGTEVEVLVTYYESSEDDEDVPRFTAFEPQ